MKLYKEISATRATPPREPANYDGAIYRGVLIERYQGTYYLSFLGRHLARAPSFAASIRKIEKLRQENPRFF